MGSLETVFLVLGTKERQLEGQRTWTGQPYDVFRVRYDSVLDPDTEREARFPVGPFERMIGPGLVSGRMRYIHIREGSYEDHRVAKWVGVKGRNLLNQPRASAIIYSEEEAVRRLLENAPSGPLLRDSAEPLLRDSLH